MRTINYDKAKFVRQLSRWGKNQFVITIPKEILRLVEPGRVFEVTLRPLGSVRIGRQNFKTTRTRNW